jgi:hypothetical protein
MTSLTDTSDGHRPGARAVSAREIFPRRNSGLIASCRRRRSFPRPAFVMSLLMVSLMVHSPAMSLAAEAPYVVVESIQVTPAAVMPGKYPDISAKIKMRTTDASIASRPISIVAVLTQPDHRTKSWVWSKVVLAPGAVKAYPLPREYTTKLIGEYKIEFTIYSGDMKRRIAASSTKFTVSDKPQEAKRPDKAAEAAAVAAPESKKADRPASEGYILGIGAYGNTANTSGGATVLFWAGKYLGVQASYTVGTFTSYEARLLGKMVTASGWNPYLGVGYLNVSKTADVIGVSTTFTDSTVSGVLGVEIPLSKRFYGYVEVAGASIDLKKIVTNGGQTVEATVDYAPVTIGAGLVFSLY